ncbi:hypothetical protein ASPWEDRAFT_181282 [Aspergillus wentii DTO 134E9]|uniref:Secreted protein n=1 Tax=Aspergillus wentii DTO 134E9 TaxID=1073089 RepID=A0A1L9RY90_ASPWE|nr:uncharacterized protein ASPWEDRAFT_181282 [Aspergillus wentii DTO 134E9]KAI9931402.1 hypothetical protein MW887_009977 [Aspergillus wentii]OJJ39930.1 hypothetical protein ASPWEDRAFT_181282 [Aspergillus wentii DTO 134E9]
MKFSVNILFLFASLAVADLHNTGVCINSGGKGVNVYNRDATEKACTAYKNRNTGSKQWDTCPDCTIKNDQSILYYCDTAAQHMGGDEWNYYCKQNGAEESLAW